jgi:hypothetical protein
MPGDIHYMASMYFQSSSAKLMQNKMLSVMHIPSLEAKTLSVFVGWLVVNTTLMPKRIL